MIKFSSTFTFGASSTVAEIDFDTLPQASKEFIINYGLKQYLNDGAAVGKDECESEDERNQLKADRVADRVTKLKDGTMSIRGGTRVTDPVAKIKRDLALDILKDFWKKNDMKALKGAELTAKIEDFWAKNGDKEQIKKVLAERIAAAQKADMGELDL